MNVAIKISDFSPHLFWDVDRNKLNFEKSKEQIVFQVVEFGLMNDWKLLQQVYSFEELKQIATSLRTLDKVTLSFLAHFFKIDKSEFRCYTTSQSAQNFWNSQSLLLQEKQILSIRFHTTIKNSTEIHNSKNNLNLSYH